MKHLGIAFIIWTSSYSQTITSISNSVEINDKNDLLLCREKAAANDCYVPLKKDSEVRISNVLVHKSPSENSSVVLEIEEHQYEYGTVLSEFDSSGFIKVHVKDKLTTGWVCICSAELKPLPFDIPRTQDTAYYIDLLDRCNWKRRYDSKNYSKKAHLVVFQNIATEYFELGKYKEAIFYFSESLNLDSQNTYALAKRAIAKHQIRDWIGSISDIDRIFKYPKDNWKGNPLSTVYSVYTVYLDDPRVDIHVINAVMGFNYFNLKEYKRSIIYFDKAIEDNNRESIYFLKRGLSKLKVGDKIGGCKDISIAGELGSDQAYQIISKECQ